MFTARNARFAAGILTASSVAGVVEAAPLRYIADIKPLSGSGVSGRADLALDRDARTLEVRVRASGLTPGMTHIQHIHGTFDPVTGAPTDAVTPSFAAGADADGDGVIELAEGVPFYGPIVLSLQTPGATGLEGFPTAPEGRIDFMASYDLDSPDTPFGSGFNADDLMPLSFREIVIHGGMLGAVGAGTPGEANGVAEYKLTLPVAAGEITPVPLPPAGFLLLGGMAGLGLLRRRSTTAASRPA